MRILLSAYSCAPNYGSEPGVGWNWSTEVARLGHDVVTLTTDLWKAETEAEIAKDYLPSNLQFVYFMPPWLGQLRAFGWRMGRVSLTEHVVQTVWQYLARHYVQRRLGHERFDLVHHVTYGGIRHTTCMAALPYPLVIGPLGGGERAPRAVRAGLPFRARIIEWLRDLHTWFVQYEPMAMSACRRAELIFVKTSETKFALPERFHEKTLVEMELGVPERQLPERKQRAAGSTMRLLFAGRLLHWKGLGLGLKAIAESRRRGHDVKLTVAGVGPAEGAWRGMVKRLGIEGSVEFLGWVPFEAMESHYSAHDALLFPSLHDSSGNAVLEALSFGTPVICFDLGGPGTIVDETCGQVVTTKDRDANDCVIGLADAIERLYQEPAFCRELSDGALNRANCYRWPEPVIRVYDKIARTLGRAEQAVT